MNDPVYLDYAASTPVDPRVREAMAAVAAQTGNPSSLHAPGRRLRAEVDLARARVARLLGVSEDGIVFTSGATEANGLAMRGVLRAIRASHPSAKLRVLVSGIEHASVMESALAMQADGEAEVDVVAAGKDGIVSAEAVAAAITDETAIVAVMWANNVVGTLQPVAEIGRAVKAARARRGTSGLPLVFVCDAVQALRTQDARTQEAGIDILALSAHKIYGPKGAGAMWVAPGTSFASVHGGGGHESGRRHGTENVEGIVGLGAAAEILLAERAQDKTHAAALRYRLLAALEGKSRAAVVGSEGVPGIVFLRFPNVKGDELAVKLDMDGIAVSAGSACDAGTRKSPRVLSALLDEQTALRGGIRISFGRFTTEKEIDRLIEKLERV